MAGRARRSVEVRREEILSTTVELLDKLGLANTRVADVAVALDRFDPDEDAWVPQDTPAIRTPSAARSSVVAANGSQAGTGCSIQPKRMSAPSRSSSTGTTPAPVSSRITAFWSGPPRTNAVPSVGCPAKGISAAGVKMRMRTSASGVVGGRTKTLSANIISFASACIVSGSRSRASVKTAIWFPVSGVSVKTSMT